MFTRNGLFFWVFFAKQLFNNTYPGSVCLAYMSEVRVVCIRVWIFGSLKIWLDFDFWVSSLIESQLLIQTILHDTPFSSYLCMFMMPIHQVPVNLRKFAHIPERSFHFQLSCLGADNSCVCVSVHEQVIQGEEKLRCDMWTLAIRTFCQSAAWGRLRMSSLLFLPWWEYIILWINWCLLFYFCHKINK